MEAIELSYENSRMATKVIPPDTVRKTAKATAHKAMATLVLDFAKDSNVIQSSNTEAFQRYLLSQSCNKRWIYNPKVERVYPDLIARSEKAFQEYQERQRQLEEERKQAAREWAELRRFIAEQQAAQREEQKRLEEEQREAQRVAALERQRKSDEESHHWLENQNFQQAEHIIDSHGNRWIQCSLCGERKTTSHFSLYGGPNQFGLCTACARKGKSS
jgi:HD superfamily phosphohydrolase